MPAIEMFKIHGADILRSSLFSVHYFHRKDDYVYFVSDLHIVKTCELYDEIGGLKN